jgi:predicted ATPase
LAEFIYEQPALGDTQYIFKHALTQEVSHSSVLLDRRRQLHESIGGAIETVFAENLEDHLAELAHHYSRSANRAKALEFLHRAGEQAIKRGSYSEAESYFAAALQMVPAIPVYRHGRRSPGPKGYRGPRPGPKKLARGTKTSPVGLNRPRNAR